VLNISKDHRISQAKRTTINPTKRLHVERGCTWKEAARGKRLHVERGANPGKACPICTSLFKLFSRACDNAMSASTNTPVQDLTSTNHAFQIFDGCSNVAIAPTFINVAHLEEILVVQASDMPQGLSRSCSALSFILFF
jgi:hypothetical protein